MPRPSQIHTLHKGVSVKGPRVLPKSRHKALTLGIQIRALRTPTHSFKGASLRHLWVHESLGIHRAPSALGYAEGARDSQKDTTLDTRKGPRSKGTRGTLGSAYMRTNACCPGLSHTALARPLGTPWHLGYHRTRMHQSTPGVSVRAHESARCPGPQRTSPSLHGHPKAPSAQRKQAQGFSVLHQYATIRIQAPQTNSTQGHSTSMAHPGLAYAHTIRTQPRF